MPKEVICPICGVDIGKDLEDPATLVIEYKAVENEDLVRRGECPHCAHKIKVHLGVDSVSVDHDAEEHRGAL